MVEHKNLFVLKIWPHLLPVAKEIFENWEYDTLIALGRVWYCPWLDNWNSHLINWTMNVSVFIMYDQNYVISRDNWGKQIPLLICLSLASYSDKLNLTSFYLLIFFSVRCFIHQNVVLLFWNVRNICFYICASFSKSGTVNISKNAKSFGILRSSGRYL